MIDKYIQNPVFIPGPTNIPAPIQAAMHCQTRDHRAPDFQDFLLPLFADLKRVFKSSAGQVITFPASGTGGWEAAITNTLSPGDTVLAARHGMFSHRWIDLCQRQGMTVDAVDSDWSGGVPLAEYARRLEGDKHHGIKAVLVTHNETATGVVSPVSEVRQLLDQLNHPALLLVDCVSSLASMDFRMDEWGVDVAVAGSQKGFMLYSGMAILAVSQKAMQAMQEARSHRAFFDFKDMLSANESGNYPYTPSVQLLQGLRCSVDLLLDEGLENVFARHRRIAEGVRAAVRGWGLSLCAQSEELYSDTVSAIRVPDGFDSTALTDHAYTHYGVSYGIGLGQMSGKVFRIGHLGSMTDAMALSGVAIIEMAMKDLNYPVELGSGVSAAQSYYSSTVKRDQRKAA